MFQPTSTHQRHQTHLRAFSISNIEEYYVAVAQFVTDPELSHENIDDLDLFISLTFESKFNHIHTRICRYLLMNIDNYEFSLSALSKFLDFLDKDATLFSNDFFHTLIRDYSPKIVERVFESLSHNLKMSFLDVITKYSDVLKQCPRIKLYIVFS